MRNIAECMEVVRSNGSIVEVGREAPPYTLEVQ
jgi:hypothetical protein